MTFLSRRLLLAIFLGIFTFFAVLYTGLPSTTSIPQRFQSTKSTEETSCQTQASPKEIPEWGPSLLVKGVPTRLFRDNLLENRGYITSWAIAGFTNQFMGYVNMIYLASLSNRITILPPFLPSHHVDKAAQGLPFGEVFNVSALRSTLKAPLLEWRDVKHLPSLSVEKPKTEELEQIGCWSTRKNIDPNPWWADPMLNHLHLDAAYTRVPAETRTNPKNADDDFVVLPGLSPYIFPTEPIKTNEKVFQVSKMKKSSPPDTHLACFDLLYYASSTSKQFEWEQVWSPMWRFVGRHVQFTDRLQSLAKEYIARALDHGSTDNMPPFIAIHMRRADFGGACGNSEKCYLDLEPFKQKVKEIKADILERHKKSISEVILFSDDETAGFWKKVSELGWRRFDHQGWDTVRTHGSWYPTLIDIAAQSMADGFIGTAHSTFSLVSLRRVTDWRNGSTALIEKH